MCYIVAHDGCHPVTEERFDFELLDPDDPFEIDEGNRPHLYKHLPTSSGRLIAVGVEDLLDIYLYGDRMFYVSDKRKGPADWILVGEVPGLVLSVPLVSSKNHDPKKCRPIGLYRASEADRKRYLGDR